MRKVLVLMLLAGCAGTLGNPVPQAARLSDTMLTVTLSDGTVCRADWVASGGSGRLDDCGAGYGYAVKVVENPNILRQLFTGLVDALGADGVSPPLGEVVITDAAGVDRVFVSPPDDGLAAN